MMNGNMSHLGSLLGFSKPWVSGTYATVDYVYEVGEFLYIRRK